MQNDNNFQAIYNEICEKEKLKNPVELLIGLANGVDLSKKSTVLEFVENLKNQYGDEMPDEFDYFDLIELIQDKYKFELVDINTQMSAQKTLVEYQHPKKKAVELTTKNEGSEISELTEREIEIFKKKFDAKY